MLGTNGSPSGAPQVQLGRRDSLCMPPYSQHNDMQDEGISIALCRQRLPPLGNTRCVYSLHNSWCYQVISRYTSNVLLRPERVRLGLSKRVRLLPVSIPSPNQSGEERIHTYSFPIRSPRLSTQVPWCPGNLRTDKMQRAIRS